jgi:hypothetical protein
MLVGLSLSRCVRDILEEKVDYDDVLVIVARTRADLEQPDHWESLWDGYSSRSGWSDPEWDGLDETQTRELVYRLWRDGKIHQPRQFGAHVVRRSEFWLQTVLPSSELERNPAARAAWDQFQTVAGLTNIQLDDKYQ